MLRGHWAGTPGLVVRRGAKSGFVGPAFAADARADLDRLASATDTRVVPHRGGLAVDLTDPSGSRSAWCTASRNCRACRSATRCS